MNESVGTVDVDQAAERGGPRRTFLTSKLTQDCVIVNDLKSDGKHVWKYTNGGKTTRKNGHVIITYVCAGCRSVYDQKKIRYSEIPKAKFNQSTQTWIDDVYSISSDEHACEPIPINEERARQLRNEAKRTISRTGASAAKIMRRVATDAIETYGSRDDVTEDDLNAIVGPLKHGAASQKQMSRAKMKGFPKIQAFSELATRAELKKFTFTIRGATSSKKHRRHEELFYRGSGDSYFLFASDSELQMLSESPELFLDGNFRFRPEGSQQVYRIFALVKGSFCLPVITAVMSRRRKIDYVELFSRIRELLTDQKLKLNAKFAHFDYEKAAVSGFKQVFDEVSVKVCSFHSKQALIRRARRDGLAPAIRRKNQVVLQLIQMLGSLQHVPSNCYSQLHGMISGWLEATLNDESNEDAGSLLKREERALPGLIKFYFNTWVNGTLGADFYCLHELTSNRTNNRAESFHSTLQNQFEKKSKPSIAEWLVVTREMNAVMVFQAELIREGRQPAPTHSTHILGLDQKILQAKVRFQQAWVTGADDTLNVLGNFAKLNGMSVEEIADMGEANETDSDHEELDADL